MNSHIQHQYPLIVIGRYPQRIIWHTHAHTYTLLDAPPWGGDPKKPTPPQLSPKKKKKKKLEALEHLYRSTGLIFLQWRKEVFNNYHSIPAF